jgi:hypothetical protein
MIGATGLFTSTKGIEIMVGKATYTNALTGEQYKLGFDFHESQTELGRACELMLMVAKLNGWNKIDVRVKQGW